MEKLCSCGHEAIFPNRTKRGLNRTKYCPECANRIRLRQSREAAHRSWLRNQEYQKRLRELQGR